MYLALMYRRLILDEICISQQLIFPNYVPLNQLKAYMETLKKNSTYGRGVSRLYFNLECLVRSSLIKRNAFD